jgi:hypothetical protein
VKLELEVLDVKIVGMSKTALLRSQKSSHDDVDKKISRDRHHAKLAKRLLQALKS